MGEVRLAGMMWGNCFGQNISTNFVIQIKGYYYPDQNTCSFKFKTNSKDVISVVGPTESEALSLPQTYWLEAKDQSDQALKSKLPVGFGKRNLKLSEEDLVDPRFLPKEHPEVKKNKGITVTSCSGPIPFYDRIAIIKEPDTFYGIRFTTKYLRKWFDLDQGKTYSIKLLLQPNKEGPIQESNPVLVTISPVEPKSK